MFFKTLGGVFLAWTQARARSSQRTGLVALATFLDYRSYQAGLQRTRVRSPISERAAMYVDQIRRDGICVVSDYWDQEKCKEARAEVDRIIEAHPEHIHPNAKADKRIYGANNISHLIREFTEDTLLNEVANAYNEEPTRPAFTLAAKMPFTQGNLGSGEGWHRDAPLRQFKAIMYLSDVELDNGPFQMIHQSHTLDQVMADTWTGRLNYPQFRITQEQAGRIIARNPDRLNTYTARAGTVILADVSAIHRGLPIASGSRYALTNYYFPIARIDASLHEKFRVVPSET